MHADSLDERSHVCLEEILGYLNFSSGKPDARLYQNINAIYRRLEESAPGPRCPWLALHQLLRTKLASLRGTSAAFAQVEQAEAALRLVFDDVLPAYRRWHRDLLFHQTDAALFRPYFVARVCEGVLSQGPPWTETERIVDGTLQQINDFLGHRPVATLRTQQRIAPYAHEWVCPVPLYYAGAGVAEGRYRELIEAALAILRETDDHLLMQAYFDPDALEVLALDPRAYDFYHPVNRRPNYQFGQWDPHLVDSKGRYRRFVLQQVTLDTLLARVDSPTGLPTDEVLYEAAAVLAGTMLMASGVSGSGPDTHDSGTSLSTLMPRIAEYRDRFYEALLSRLQGSHGDRLRAEAAALRQPFGATRQHLNQGLARLRAAQLEHVHLAQIFAQMGYSQASLRQAHIVPVASARMLCEIRCRITDAHRAVDRGALPEAAGLLSEIEDLLHRAIECGAFVDPWNILGFQGQFSIFAALENSVRDHRVDQLVRLMERIFDLFARVHRAIAAVGETPGEDEVLGGFTRLAEWWDRFATTQVSGVRPISGEEALESAEHVSVALGAWRDAGEAAGDISFWRQQVEQFTAPKTYALVVEALLEKKDFVAAMALLMQWLNQAEQMPLDEGEVTFHELAVRWVEGVEHAATNVDRPWRMDPWTLIRKFFDYFEANAEEYWDVPEFEVSGKIDVIMSMPLDEMEFDDEEDEDDEELDDEDEDEGLFSAAYENMSYHDSTDDGFEGDIIESGGQTTELELDYEAERIGSRLALLSTVGRLWKSIAGGNVVRGAAAEANADEQCAPVLAAWLARALENRKNLMNLLGEVHRYRIPAPSGTRESLIEYDRRRIMQQALLNRIIDTYVVMSDAARWLIGCQVKRPEVELDAWEALTADVLRAMSRGEAAEVRRLFPQLAEALVEQPLLYVPLARKGDPRRKAHAQNLQHVLRELLGGLPRLGLLSETLALIDTAQAMEKRHPVGDGAVTEFNRLCGIGFTAIVEALVDAAGCGGAAGEMESQDSDRQLVACLETVTEVLLKRWLKHSRSARISVLERVATEERWAALRQFIETYGDDLFTQQFLNVGNLRAILHQGVDSYLRSLEEDPATEDEPIRLLNDLDVRIPRSAAVSHFEMVLETIIENYAEYEDYNTTTTQSDHGSCLYMLLDFLRLKASYERVAWNLKPVVIAHEALVRGGKVEAAEQWRRSMTEKTTDVAKWHLTRLAELSRRHGMKLASVSDRIEERFVRPLVLDRIRAMVRPAVEEARRGTAGESFARLEREIDEFTKNPTGAGLDVPAWLVALEQEVDRVDAEQKGLARRGDPVQVPRCRLTLAEAQQQLDEWN